MPLADKIKMIRNSYLYLVALAGVVIVMIGGIILINTGLKYFILGVENLSIDYSWRVQACYEPEYMPAPIKDGGTVVYDKKVEKTPEETQKCVAKVTESAQLTGKVEAKRDLSLSLAMLIVGLPVWFYHWRTIQKDKA